MPSQQAPYFLACISLVFFSSTLLFIHFSFFSFCPFTLHHSLIRVCCTTLSFVKMVVKAQLFGAIAATMFARYDIIICFSFICVIFFIDCDHASLSKLLCTHAVQVEPAEEPSHSPCPHLLFFSCRSNCICLYLESPPPPPLSPRTTLLFSPDRYFFL